MIFEKDIKKFLKMEPIDFDQSSDGYKSLIGDVSEVYIALLIQKYIEKNKNKFNKNNKDSYLPIRVLYFHAGQAFAGSGSKYYEEAIDCMRKGYKDKNEDGWECWNAYVDGTIGFLQGDISIVYDQIKLIENSNAKNKRGGNIDLLYNLSKALNLGVADYLRASTISD